MLSGKGCGDARDSQDVGLEAAIIKRKRNSSLVEWHCAENLAGLKHTPKLRNPVEGVVGEHSVGPAKVDREDLLEGTEEIMPA